MTTEITAEPTTGAASTLIDAAPTPEPNQNPAPPKVEDAGLKLPGKDAKPEDWATFYKQIGRPEKPEEYEIPVPEGMDGAFAKEMAPILHKHGLTTAQAKGLAEDWNAMQSKQQQDAIKAIDAQNKVEEADLKNEWGQNHDANMHFAKLAVKQFLPQEKAGAMIDAIESAIGYKATIQFLHGIGKGLGEHDAAGMGDNNGGASAKSLAERLYGASGKS